MPKIQNCKYVLRHKPTGMYASRTSDRWCSLRGQSVDAYLTSHINDCRVFTNKSSASNAEIFRQNKEEFERVPVTLVILNEKT